MGSLHQICLRWNNHQSNILQIFNKVLNSTDFVDCTLSCEGKSLKAHKIILSACSPYFHSLFLDNPCKHPIVILRDVKYLDLKSIVEYIYKGEVSIDREQLPEFLRSAQSLQIKGLSADDNESTPPPMQSVLNNSEDGYHVEEESRPVSDMSYQPAKEPYLQRLSSIPKVHTGSSTLNSKPKDKNRSSSASAVPAKMPRLSSVRWKEEQSLPPLKPHKRIDILESDTQTATSDKDSVHSAASSSASDTNYSSNVCAEGGGDDLNVAVNCVKSEVGQESPLADNDLPYDYSAESRLGDLDHSVGLSDASDGGEMSMENTTLDPGGSFTNAGPSSHENSTPVVVKQSRGRSRSSRWSMATMQQALSEVVSGRLTVSRASKFYQIPERTMYLYWSRLKNFGVAINSDLSRQ